MQSHPKTICKVPNSQKKKTYVIVFRFTPLPSSLRESLKLTLGRSSRLRIRRELQSLDQQLLVTPHFSLELLWFPSALLTLCVCVFAQVGGIKPGCFKIGNTGGMLDNILASKLYRPGSVAYVSRSGGMSNELNNIISRTTDGVFEGVAIGGDRYVTIFICSM